MELAPIINFVILIGMIVLTVLTWRNGWGWRALIPFVASLVFAVDISESCKVLIVLSYLLHLLALVALVLMVRQPRRVIPGQPA